MSDEDPAKVLKRVTDLRFILDYLLEIGLSMMSSGGLTAVTWTEIKSWKALTCTELTVSEIKLIRELSLRYVSQYLLSKDPNCPRPFENEDEQKSDLKFKRSAVFSPRRRNRAN